MKKLTTLFLTIVSSVMLAQTIPNFSFENWSGSPSNPTGWYTLNAILTGSTTESNMAWAASHSAQLNSVLALGQNYGGVLGSGTLSDIYFATGLSSNPAALTGWYELAPVSGDELKIIVVTKNGSTVNGGDTSSIKTTTAGAWKEFSICLNYISGTADSAAILFQLSGSDGSDSTHNGSSALIDDLVWGACGTSGVEDISNNVTLEPSYPNPANDICNIIFSIPGTSLVNADLYDLNGRKIMNLMNNANLSSGRYKIPVDVSKFANGVYFYTITVDGVPYTQKLVVAK